MPGISYRCSYQPRLSTPTRAAAECHERERKKTRAITLEQSTGTRQECVMFENVYSIENNDCWRLNNLSVATCTVVPRDTCQYYFAFLVFMLFVYKLLKHLCPQGLIDIWKDTCFNVLFKCRHSEFVPMTFLCESEPWVFLSFLWL